MSLFHSFGSGKHRAAEEALRSHITALQTALDRYEGVARRSAQARLKAMGAVAVFFLALGFASGVYREPILQSARYLAANLGIYADDANAALAQAHRLDDARAQTLLALQYYRGLGVTQDYMEAVKWFRRAAEQSYAPAQFYLGIMFAEGEGVPQNRAEAAKWFRLAADRGNPEAQYNLGLAYATGEGVPPDYVSAHMWFNLAATGFAASDASRRSAAMHNRDAVAARMTRAQVAEAERLANSWNAATQASVVASR